MFDVDRWYFDIHYISHTNLVTIATKASKRIIRAFQYLPIYQCIINHHHHISRGFLHSVVYAVRFERCIILAQPRLLYSYIMRMFAKQRLAIEGDPLTTH